MISREIKLPKILSDIPLAILSNITKYYDSDESSKGKIELVVIFNDTVDNFKRSVESIGGTFENLDYGYGIIVIDVNSITRLDEVEGIQYLELPKILSTNDYGSNRAACVISAWEKYGLSGEGVLVGFLDTGIDFNHPAFIDSDGNTRIEYIYDIFQDKVYNKDQINEAIKSADPYSMIPEDISGHGTHVAGIACAGGNIPFDNYGVAYKSNLIVVKITRSGDLTAALSTQLMRGIKFLSDKSTELKKPLVINISLSTNDGAHNGTSILEKYIQTISTLKRASIVVAAGNEGAAEHHVGGEIKPVNDISFNISKDEKNIVMQLYRPVLTDLTVELISPTGDSSSEIQIAESFIEKQIGNDRAIVYTSGPRPFDITGQITIAITSVSDSENITEGNWRIIVKNTSSYSGYFDIWLPITEGLNLRTKFLESEPLNTLGIPATVEGVISVGSYNYLNDSLSPFSGRGVERVGWIRKPDVLAPGENISSASAGSSGFATRSGTSMAAPHVAGICALLFEWGIVKGNDIELYGERVKYYLARGAQRTRTDIQYPDDSFGYGFVCAEATITDLVNRR